MSNIRPCAFYQPSINQIPCIIIIIISSIKIKITAVIIITIIVLITNLIIMDNIIIISPDKEPGCRNAKDIPLYRLVKLAQIDSHLNDVGSLKSQVFPIFWAI